MEMEAAVVAVESMVWDIEGAATRKPEIEIEEQPEIVAEAVAAAGADDAAMAGDAEGASGTEIGAQRKVFDPGKVPILDSLSRESSSS